MSQRLNGEMQEIATSTVGNDTSRELFSADRELIQQIRSRKLTYLTDRKLACIANTCRSAEDAGLAGAFLEAGCALGGSTVMIASNKKRERPLWVYDLFGMIPPPTEKDTQDAHNRYRVITSGKSAGIGGDQYYGYRSGLYEVVKANLECFGIDCAKQSVTLIQGMVQETMRLDEPIAFAHIDVDWYEPVMACLERVFPKLVLGGSIILDDYHDWGGCRKAVDEYLRKIAGQVKFSDAAGSMKITRTCLKTS